jgi:hypothetical protein
MTVVRLHVTVAETTIRLLALLEELESVEKCWHRVRHFSSEAIFSVSNCRVARQLQARFQINRTLCPVVERRK